MNTSTLSPGFADPVADAQSCFRAVLDAMARPGRICIRSGTMAAPPPLCAAAAAVLLTLVDHETPLWLDPAAEPAPRLDRLPYRRAGRAGTAAMFALALSLPDLAELPNRHR